MQAIDMDTAALRAVAAQFDAVAQLAARAAATRLAFDVTTAGRRYLSEGEAVRRLTARLVDQMSDWARAAREIAIELRCDATRYAESDRNAGAGIG